MERVASQMESHPVGLMADPEAVARISKEIIPLEEQVCCHAGVVRNNHVSYHAN